MRRCCSWSRRRRCWSYWSRRRKCRSGEVYPLGREILGKSSSSATKRINNLTTMVSFLPRTGRVLLKILVKIFWFKSSLQYKNPDWSIHVISMPSYPLIENIRKDIHVSMLHPWTMDSSIFKWMRLLAWILSWTLHGYFTPGKSKS